MKAVISLDSHAHWKICNSIIMIIFSTTETTTTCDESLQLACVCWATTAEHNRVEQHKHYCGSRDTATDCSIRRWHRKHSGFNMHNEMWGFYVNLLLRFSALRSRVSKRQFCCQGNLCNFLSWELLLAKKLNWSSTIGVDDRDSWRYMMKNIKEQKPGIISFILWCDTL